jgi:transcriptional regulator with XRE-family HTH domain
MKEWTPKGQALGEVVRKRRRELGMSQADFACRCGLTRTYISLLERGLCGDLLAGLPAELLDPERAPERAAGESPGAA